MTRAALNQSIWAISLVLQVSLLALVFTRGLARRLPLFTVLLVFYPLRSVLLFALARPLLADDYADLYRGLALAGLMLLLVVELRLAFGLVRWQMVLVLAVGAWAMTMALVFFLPKSGPLPVDRVEVFASAFAAILAIYVAVRGRDRHAPPRWVALGLGAYGAVDLCATVAKTRAAMVHANGEFAAWSYAVSLTYLAVVVLWMFVLRPVKKPTPRLYGQIDGRAGL